MRYIADQWYGIAFRLGRFFRTPLGTLVSILILLSVLAILVGLYVAFDAGCGAASDPGYCEDLRHPWG